MWILCFVHYRLRRNSGFGEKENKNKKYGSSFFFSPLTVIWWRLEWKTVLTFKQTGAFYDIKPFIRSMDTLLMILSRERILNLLDEIKNR